MKKTIVLLSALALAANAYAADKLEAGTADAPNYYVFKAGRGTPYLAYSDDYISAGNGIETRIYRTHDLGEANIWEVTPGSVEGTLHIAAYTNNTRGLMNFINKDGSSYAINAVATAVKAENCDIYPTYLTNDTISLNLKNTQGYETVREGENTVTQYYSLDATGGSDFCGNWIANNGAGTKWVAYKLDMSHGAEDAIAKLQNDMVTEAGKTMVNNYIGYFQEYINNVPWVAGELNAGIEELKNLEIKAGYDTIVPVIWQTACNNANAKLATVFDGKTLAVRSLYKLANNLAANTLSVDTVAGKIIPIDGFSEPTATFVFTSTEGGYTLYNAATKRYLSKFNDPNVGCVPTAVADSAMVVFPVLHSFDTFNGIAFPIAKDYNQNTAGINVQKGSTKVSYWSISGDCPIWSVVDASDEARVKEAVETGLATLKAYVPNVPDMVALILTSAISNLEAMDPATATIEEVNQLVDATIADANAMLADAMNGITLTLCNLRQNKFIAVEDETWVYSVYNDTPATAFHFKGQADGGYILLNEETGIYFGGIEEVPNTDGSFVEKNVMPTTTEADAMTIYPFLCQGGGFSGIAMALEANPTATSQAINTNANTFILHTYSAGDAGSIFALLAPNTVVNSIDEMKVAPVKIEGIYDLSGRKLAAPVKGINIINGKKVLVR